MLINVTDVVDGALVNAIALAGRRISKAAVGLHGRRRADDVSIARWFETYRLTDDIPDLPDLAPALAERVVEVLSGDEAQAALQELLAVRLTDAAETDAAKARQVLSLTIAAAGPDAAAFADSLAEYCDDQIGTLVARLEADDPPLLAQIRSEAFSTRMINILNAIERHTAALTARPARRTEADFLTRYRRHVIEQHGKLEPPDFDRRRRIPILEIYVPTTISEEASSGQSPAARPQDVNEALLTVYDLAKLLDRSVLLGDPGGGKTTAANVLMHHFTETEAGPTPFLVTLREYAAKDPPEQSILNHIEYLLETFYQCPPPPGLVDLLLLTGRGIVIFDGLDELLDTSRRRDVTSRVERFCTEYPQCPVLVTSRLVGYEQARLDDRQFLCYKLGGFNQRHISDYAKKWFAQDTDARQGDAEAFLAESASVPDLRVNPLMLALLCILYRGEGSLPRNRAEVYESCATLLYRKWDGRRRIHQDLRAGHLIEPLLRNLAWWLFNRDDAQSAATERDLLTATMQFLYGRGFESEDEAREASREFIEFSRGRMWVFNDAGTVASGERLYAFTHRTFLEYFSAAWLAYDCDTPEQLAESLASHIAAEEWWMVAELAVQLKANTSTNGAQRFYAKLLDDTNLRASGGHLSVLRFLVLCLRSVDPAPKYVRELTKQLLNHTFMSRMSPWFIAVRELLSGCGSYRGVVLDEFATVATSVIQSNNLNDLTSCLWLLLTLADYFGASDFLTEDDDPYSWTEFLENLLEGNGDVIVAVAAGDAYVRQAALRIGLLTTERALEMPGGLTVLFQDSTNIVADLEWVAYLPQDLMMLLGYEQWDNPFGNRTLIGDLEAVGEYLLRNPKLPWIVGDIQRWNNAHESLYSAQLEIGVRRAVSPIAYLGAVAIAFILCERAVPPFEYIPPDALTDLSSKSWNNLEELPCPWRVAGQVKDRTEPGRRGGAGGVLEVTGRGAR